MSKTFAVFRTPFLAVMLLGATALAAHAQDTNSFDFTVAQPGLTSAGVYDQKGRLVRVLWTLKQMQAGEQRAGWDGKDNDGKDAPAGTYSYKVVVNRSTYKNVGVIGNTGTNTFNHVPNNFECVAVDGAGNAYTVHDWDEPHHDVKMWSAKDGHVISHSGHVIGGLLKAVAVDDKYAYTTTYENIGNRQDAKFYINRLKIDKTPGTGNWPVEPFTKAGTSLMVYNGNNSAAFPAGASDADKGVMTMPLLSLAVAGDTLYATDSLAGKVHMYDKVTGEEKGAIEVKLPQSVAIGDDGRIWVGHESSQVSVFDGDGRMLGTPVTDAQGLNAIAVRGNTLYIADAGAGQVKIYDITGNDAKLNHTFGDKARPGDRASHRFYNLHGLAVDKAGNMFTVQNEYFFNGGRIAKSDPTGKPLWEQECLEFVSNAAYSATNPDWLISLEHHGYSLDRKTGTTKNTGNTYNGDGYKSTIGPIRAGKLGNNEFVWMGNGDGMIVYRVVPSPDKFRGPTLKLASIVAGSSPLPNGTMASAPWEGPNHFLWSWHDDKGDGKIDDGEQVIFQKPENNAGLWQHGSLAADAKGNLWFPSYDWAGGRGAGEIWVLPMLGLDKQGNPIYEWKMVRRATSIDQTKMPTWSAVPRLVQAADDGSVYAYGGTQRAGAPQNGGLHMGGNTLIRFTLKKGAKLNGPDIPLPKGPVPFGSPDYIQTPVLTDLQWMVVMPDVAVGLDVIPTGKQLEQSGVMVGGTPGRGVIHHYTKDGLLIGTFQSDPARFGGLKDDGQVPTGLMDFYGALSINRDPRDGILDVFVEDDYNDRIFWYRVDDHDITTLSGTLEKP